MKKLNNVVNLLVYLLNSSIKTGVSMRKIHVSIAFFALSGLCNNINACMVNGKKMTLAQTEQEFKTRSSAEQMHHLICSTDRTDLVPKYKEWGADPNAQHCGDTPLTTIIHSPFIIGQQRVLRQRIKFVPHLIAAGATLVQKVQPLGSCFAEEEEPQKTTAPAMLKQRIEDERKEVSNEMYYLLRDSRKKVDRQRNFFMIQERRNKIQGHLHNLKDLKFLCRVMQLTSGVNTSDYKKLETEQHDQSSSPYVYPGLLARQTSADRSSSK